MQLGENRLLMEIRPLTDRDKRELMALLKNTPEFGSADLAVAEELCDSYLKDSTASGYHIFVLCRDSNISGYICYGPTPLTEGTWDVYWIAVAGAERGLGLGKSLLKFAEQSICETNARLVLIETSSRKDYDRTRGFYHSMGYEEVSRIPDFYMPGEDKLVLWKKLK